MSDEDDMDMMYEDEIPEDEPQDEEEGGEVDAENEYFNAKSLCLLPTVYSNNSFYRYD
jgi:hypothetical protein